MQAVFRKSACCVKLLNGLVNFCNLKILRYVEKFKTHFLYDRLLLLLAEAFELPFDFESDEDFQYTDVLNLAHPYLSCVANLQKCLNLEGVANARILPLLSPQDIAENQVVPCQTMDYINAKLASMTFT